jgi:hypothetical protein
MNFLSECLIDFQHLKLQGDAFQAQVCARCRNGKCELSHWRQDPFKERIATQPDRFFHPQQADPTSSRYAHLVDFGDMLHQAMRLEISARRQDWVVPEIGVADGRIEPASRPAADPIPVAPIPDMEPFPEDEPPEEPAPEPQPQMSQPAAAPMRLLKVPGTLPAMKNVPRPEQGIMIGGGPAAPAAPTPAAVDPWTPKTDQPKVVPPGSRIRFGLTGKIDG